MNRKISDSVTLLNDMEHVIGLMEEEIKQLR